MAGARLAVSAMALLCAFAVLAGELDFLPESVATVDGYSIGRDAVISRMRRSGSNAATPDRSVLQTNARRAAEAEIYFHLLGRLLKKEGIAPSGQAAAARLAELEATLPRGIPGRTPEELSQLAADETFRWNVAVHSYLLKVQPEAVAVSDFELEQAYRLNQERFRLPERYVFGVIRILKSRPDAKELAEATRARLVQGENFDRVAAEVDPAGSEVPDAELLALLAGGNPALPLNSVSKVLENEQGYFLIKVKAKIPGRYVPLAEAAPYLKLQLSSGKAARALEELLRRELAGAKIEFFI